jgi:hypothetical protein
MPHDRLPKAHSWFDHLAAAGTPDEVVRVAREYLATWSPEEIARLPAECRPPRALKFPEEVVDYAFALVKSHVNDGSQDEAMTRMASFFAEASWRVAAAMSALESAGADNDTSY